MDDDEDFCWGLRVRERHFDEPVWSGWEPEDRDAINEAYSRANNAAAGTITSHGD